MTVPVEPRGESLTFGMPRDEAALILNFGTSAPYEFDNHDIALALSNIANRRADGIFAAHWDYYNRTVVRFNTTDNPKPAGGGFDVSPAHWANWNIVQSHGQTYVEPVETRTFEAEALIRNADSTLREAGQHISAGGLRREDAAHYLTLLGERPQSAWAPQDNSFTRRVRIESSHIVFDPAASSLTVHTPVGDVDPRTFISTQALGHAQMEGRVYSVGFHVKAPPAAIGLTRELTKQAAIMPILQARYLRRLANNAFGA